MCRGAENSLKWEKKARIIGIYSQFGNELVDLDNIWSRLILNANLLSTHHKKFTRKAFSGQTNRGQTFFQVITQYYFSLCFLCISRSITWSKWPFNFDSIRIGLFVLKSWCPDLAKKSKKSVSFPVRFCSIDAWSWLSFFTCYYLLINNRYPRSKLQKNSQNVFINTRFVNDFKKIFLEKLL